MKTFTSRQYLQIDIANKYGLDRETHKAKLDWFQKNQYCLADWIGDAEEPASYYAGIQAWNQTKNGYPTGYMISLDSTASGIQIMAVLMGDTNAATWTNCFDSDDRYDIYTHLYNKMGAMKATRKEVKKAIMTAIYGSEDEPFKLLGSEVNKFYSTLAKEIPFVWHLNQLCQRIWNPNAKEYNWTLPDNFHVVMKVERTNTERVNFMGKPIEVSYKVNQPKKFGKALCANTIHSVDGFIVRELVRRCSYNPKQINHIQKVILNCWDKPEYVEDNHTNSMLETLWNLYTETGYLSARILDYINEENIHFIDRSKIQGLIDSLPKEPFDLLTTHDCFKCHPNYGNSIRKQYNLQLHLLHHSKILPHILKQITGQTYTVTQQEKFENKLLDGTYSIC